MIYHIDDNNVWQNFAEDYNVENPFLYYPNENKIWKFVLQAHIRGRSVHFDLRIQISDKLLVGYTLDWVKSLRREPKDLSDAKMLISNEMPKAWKLMKDPLKNVVVQLKAVAPIEWLRIDDAVFKPGTVGTTKNKFGYMIIVDRGDVEFGALRPDFREYFFHGKNMPDDMTFRLLPNVWRKLSIHEGEPSKTGEKYVVWQCFPSKKLEPYTISQRAKKKSWYPPVGISALPKNTRRQIPRKFQYWNKKNESDMKKVRDDLIDAIKEKEIVLKFAEDIPGLDGLYLVEPHGKLIHNGDKTIIVKTKDFSNMTGKDLYLISGSLCYGIINLETPKRISKAEFKQLTDDHRISNFEANTWWQLDKKEKPDLFVFNFQIKTLRPPIEVEIPHGVQTFVKYENIKFNPKDETEFDSLLSVIEGEWE